MRFSAMASSPALPVGSGAGSGSAAGAPPPPSEIAVELSNDPRVQAAIDRLAQSPSGARIVRELDEKNTWLVVGSKEHFDKKAPGASGYMRSGTNTIVMHEAEMADPDTAALVLAHEGAHALDDPLAVDIVGGPVDVVLHNAPYFVLAGVVVDVAHLVLRGLQNVVGGLVGGIDGAVRGNNLLEAAGQGTQHVLNTRDETPAFQQGALVANELGIEDIGYGTAPDGSLRSAPEILRQIEQSGGAYQASLSGPARVVNDIIQAPLTGVAMLVRGVSRVLTTPQRAWDDQIDQVSASSRR